MIDLRSTTCIAWGALGDDALAHLDCPVIVVDPGQVEPSMIPTLPELPALCPCNCKVCKDAWWRKRRPVIRDGVVYYDDDRKDKPTR